MKLLRLDKTGKEKLSPKPVSVKVAIKSPNSETARIRAIIANELSQHASAHGFETFEDANDFDVEEDYVDPFTKNAPFEHDADNEELYDAKSSQSNQEGDANSALDSGDHKSDSEEKTGLDDGGSPQENA